MPTNDDIVSALKGTMTHQPPQPNPAQPYLDAAKAFYGGGLQGLANQQGIQTPEWSQKLGAVLNSPAAKDAAGVLGIPALGALRLAKPTLNAPSNYSSDKFYHILDDSGNKVGSTSLRFNPETKDLIVKDIGSDLSKGVSPDSAAYYKSQGAQSLGFSNIRSLIDAFKDEFPTAERIRGMRVSGARPQAKWAGIQIRPPAEARPGYQPWRPPLNWSPY